MALKGKIIMIGETQSVGDNGFTKREMAVETNEQYPQKVLVEFIKEKCDLLDSYNVGDNVAIDINLRGRAWTNPEGEVKYFNSLQGWKISKEGSVAAETQNDSNDDLPF